MITSNRTLWCICGLMLISANVVRGQSTDEKVLINGFSGWYVRDIGTGDPEFNNVDFTFSMTIRMNSQLSVAAQIHLVSSDDRDNRDLEVAAATWQQSTKLGFQLGRSKLPFGIYTSFFDVGTYRPFLLLPESFYGEAGFLTESYTGGGVFGGFESEESDWLLDYDVYLGTMVLELERAFRVVVGAEEIDETEELKSVLGGRLRFSTPWSGLAFGLSGFAGKPTSDEEVEEKSRFGDHVSIAVHAERVAGPWSMRAEWGVHEGSHGIDLRIFASYAELAYKITSHWEVAGRYDKGRVDLDEIDIDPSARGLLEHEEKAVGLNYWIGRNFVLKVSWHRESGNLFVHPEGDELLEAVESGLDSNRNSVRFGSQFSF